MEAAKLQPINSVADIVVLNQDKNVLLFVVVKAKKLQENSHKQEAIIPINSFLQKYNKNSCFTLVNKPFVMLADLENIVILKYHSNNLSDPLISMETGKILSNYDDAFNQLSNSNRISGFYLKTLVEAWLRDLAYHWKSPNPPESEKLKDIGLLQQIEGGDTYSQVNLDGDTLH